MRHPLDAVCSLRVGICGGCDHHPRPLDWEDWLGRSLVERCAHHWAVINGDGFVEAETSRRHSRPDHSRRVGRWRENLSADEVDAVWPIVADAAATFGYGRP